MRAPFPPEPGVKRYLLKFKSLVDPSKVSAVVSPHIVKLENGLVGASKSREELEQKLSRGSAAGIPLSKKRMIADKRTAFLDWTRLRTRLSNAFCPSFATEWRCRRPGINSTVLLSSAISWPGAAPKSA